MAAVPQDADAIEVERFAADVTAFELRAPHAGAHSLDDQVSFEFRDGADNHHDRPTQRRTVAYFYADILTRSLASTTESNHIELGQSAVQEFGLQEKDLSTAIRSSVVCAIATVPTNKRRVTPRVLLIGPAFLYQAWS